MTKTRYELTGEWSGPQSPAGDFVRVVHRETITDRELIQWVKSVYGIRYSDGTMLYLSVRELMKGERAKPDRLGYKSLIRQCFEAQVDSVDALPSL